MTGPADPGQRGIWVRLLLYPGHTLPTAAAPVVVGVGLAVRDGVAAATPAALAFVGSWLIHVGGVFLDNHELLRRHAHVVEHPELTAAVRSGALRLPTLRLAIAGCFVLALICGLWLVGRGGALALLLGAVGVAASAGYAAGPRPYARLGLADPIFLLLFGVIAVLGTYYGQAAWHAPAVTLAEGSGRLPAAAFVVGLPVGALVTGVLVIDDLRDHEHDRAKGWRTVPVRFGPQASRREFRVLMASAYAAPAALWWGLGLSPAVLLPLATLPEAWAITRIVVAAGRREQLVPMTPRLARLALVYALLLALGLGLPAAV